MSDDDTRRAVAEALWAVEKALRLLADAPATVATGPPLPGQDLVTLNQLAAMVGLSKAGMQRYAAKLPAPARRARHGQAHLYSWAEARPALEVIFGVRLPERFPAARG